jgi:hypothetical protein
VKGTKSAVNILVKSNVYPVSSVNRNPVSSNRPMTAYVRSWTELLKITDSELEMDNTPQLILDLSLGSFEHLMETKVT